METSQYYAGKGNRASADWWHDRANLYVGRLAARHRVEAVKSA
jgi:hypothetical protein